MNWTTHFTNSYWKIESNAIGTNKTFYDWGKAFIKVTCLDVSTQYVLNVAGVDYTFYLDDEELIVEITDLIRAYTGGEIDFIDETPTTIYTLEWTSIKGEIPTDLNFETLPFEIPLRFDSVIPFFVQLSENMYYWVVDEWQLLTISDIMSYDILSFDKNQLLRASDYKVVNFIDIDCITDKILVEWVGRFGQIKSWWFELDKIASTSDKQINLQTIENGYNKLKNKRTSYIVSYKKADTITQQYLSDIVLADEVYVYLSNDEASKQQITVENNSFEVGKRKQDINLVLKINSYDTI